MNNMENSVKPTRSRLLRFNFCIAVLLLLMNNESAIIAGQWRPGLHPSQMRLLIFSLYSAR